MKFSNRKHRQAPTIIIISLIDILIVLLIFMMVTTTFRQQPALKLVLPESKQAKEGGSQDSHSLVVTVAKQEPYFYLGQRPVTIDHLQEELNANAARDPQVAVWIRSDEDATVQRLLEALDAVKTAGVKNFHMLAKNPGRH